MNITKVNLLNSSNEPSDEQLESLMCEVVADAKARAEIVNIDLINKIKQEIVAVRKRYNLPVAVVNIL